MTSIEVDALLGTASVVAVLFTLVDISAKRTIVGSYLKSFVARAEVGSFGVIAILTAASIVDLALVDISTKFIFSIHLIS